MDRQTKTCPWHNQGTSSLALQASFVLLFLMAPTTFAQRPLKPPAGTKSIDPRAEFRPDGFSNFVGKYSCEVNAAPTEVHVEDAIRLEIRITGAVPDRCNAYRDDLNAVGWIVEAAKVMQEKYEPNRKHLHNLFPLSWAKDFYRHEMRDEHKILRADKTWLFVYQLKPKHVNVKAIDGIKLVYYDPAFGPERGFITLPSDPIKLAVKPKPEVVPNIGIDDSAFPASFYEGPETGTLLAPIRTLLIPPLFQIALFLGLVPVTCVIGVLAFRRLRPAAAALEKRSRGAAAQRAFAQLRTGEPAWIVVERYLQERFAFPAVDATPAEVAIFLKRHGFALVICEQARVFLDVCDAARFMTAAAAPTRDAAARLIEALEADPCARS